jgi:hypothetical protein
MWKEYEQQNNVLYYKKVHYISTFVLVVSTFLGVLISATNSTFQTVKSSLLTVQKTLGRHHTMFASSNLPCIRACAEDFPY